MSESKWISLFIDAAPARVYNFAGNPENLPRWASGLSGAVEKIGDSWVASSPMGKVRIAFAPRNEFGVLDHEVILDSGQKFLNPMRVVANGDGSEISFTLMRAPGMSDQDFAADEATIRKDLATLKSILEAKSDA